MQKRIQFGSRFIGEDEPVYIVAEVGINHNGDIETALELVDVAARVGCDAVKFQKRLPEACVPDSQRGLMRETPWGLMTYLDYRRKMELGESEYDRIADQCREQGIDWFASCWDVKSVDFMLKYNPVCVKVPSAMLTNSALLRHINQAGVAVILSTGMSTMEEISNAVSLLDADKLMLTHTTSAYPCKPEELNLRMIRTLKKEFGCPVGYSGHEVGLQTSIAAVALGACLVERHITLDRSMWGSDQAASVEPGGMARLVRDIRVVESALGTGIKEVFETEKPAISKLRGRHTDCEE